jgi:tetratricopeptide (TPR) repeat protein
MKTAFLSSTAKDLTKYRKAAYKAIEGLEDWHCVRMEDFGARDAMADEFCREKVAECDVFAGIIGHCYGSSPTGSEKSYTEQEYDAAIATDKPRLMFLAPEDFPLPAYLIESDERRAKQRAFRDQVNAERIRDTFTSPDDLAKRVVQAIRNWEHEQATVKERPSARPEGVLPLPPQPYFAHPYALQRNFTGRARERCQLTEWFTSDTRPLFAYIAIGGMGKSALTWAWLQRDVLGLPLPGVAEEERAGSTASVPEASRPEGVLWWSFYERESTFQKFLDQALTYASGGTVDARAIPSIRERMQALYNLLCQRRFLLVLDGVERILRAYARMDAAYRGDEFEKDKRGDFRSCTDLNAGTFLQWLASGAVKSKVLLTSRLFPRELNGLAGCQRVDLTAFDPEDAVIFFHAQGVKGTRAEIQAACKPYGYLPLALRLLSGLIVRDKRTPGDVQVASRYPVLPELKGKEQHHILEVAYNALDKKKRELLSRISAFRSPMTYEALSVFNTYKSETEFDAALDELINRGLLLFDRERGCYDLHPIVRGYAYDRLMDKEGVHTRLRDYFAAVPVPDEEAVQSLDDLAPVIELYHHTVQAGRYDEAVQLYRDRLADPLYFRLGAYQTEIELLRALFPGSEPFTPSGETTLPQLSDERSQGWTLNVLAASYSFSGQPRRAVPLYEAQAALCEKASDKTSLAINVGAVASVGYLPLGELAIAKRNMRRRIELCREVRDEFEEAVGHQDLGQLLAYQGAFDEAARELDVAMSIFNKRAHKQGIGVSWAYRALRALLMGDTKAALEATRKAREYYEKDREETDQPVERDLIKAEWLLGTVHRALGHLPKAETHLTEALTRCRRINLVESESDILLEMARLRWAQAQGDEVTSDESTRLQEEALGLAREALTIADRCEYRLKQADIHNFLAQVALEKGDHEEARKQAEIAKERAWCDGPPHCYKPALEEAERMLELCKHE